ncbi:hypothetical protein ACXWOS_10315, partial [Streptococcus pyogenes]
METQNKLTSFTISLKSSLLGHKCSNWTSASCRESHSTSRGEKSSNRGWVQVLSDKLSKAAAELVGLKEP